MALPPPDLCAPSSLRGQTSSVTWCALLTRLLRSCRAECPKVGRSAWRRETRQHGDPRSYSWRRVPRENAFLGRGAMVPKRSPKKCGPGLRTACEPMVALGLVTPRGLEPPTETWQGLGAGSCVLRGWGWAPHLKPRDRGIGAGRGGSSLGSRLCIEWLEGGGSLGNITTL